ncbi:MAG TPA: diguanylate cyclase [Marinilabiliales bacterium]|nr:dihydroorotate dehydrogenase-like protein [Salinivirgaceae bacterium]OFX38519.1 MAG: diguanylate cyclase [Bacteroidetes bacterium GWA2_40_14]OFX61232.1 MAG: diguanylate cyclase [Bacteroidetes bacterium GWC2_40_13]OFX75234.1 MAG: diguanylate cyclase [Bacteroidetes bacterium GWD2_40_43]OFX89831.1 MAG: diguanylate cyclase [Bacteroidetes bacterium GWE2_40_63]OFY21976.1 MAG: diguanylate cyclase [Bacteroidetes bacterium GWF2_40_13]OFZ30323.1 MAG: diguanylate cyclase [Bacteroidetes bacterium RIFO
MANLQTKYLGLNLKNPLIVSSSGITNSIEKIKEAEKQGAAAVVLKSIFEEQINFEAAHLQRIGKDNAEAYDYLQGYVTANSIEKHLALIKEAKKSVSIPVIVSINGYSDKRWVEFAKQFEAAGADALELNIYIIPDDRKKSGSDIEKEYFSIIKQIVKKSNIPVSVKLTNQFTNLIHVVDSMKSIGVKGVVLFNRFYEPDIDTDTMEMTNSNVFSSEADIRFPLRWTAIISDKVKGIDYSASTGVHDADGMIKLLLAGANTVQVCSVLYAKGLGEIHKILDGTEAWMRQRGFDSVDSIRGLMSYRSIPDSTVYQRSQFMKYFSNFE